MSAPRILVAGIGNIFFGDDAFGVEVVQHLMRRALPAEVRVVDFGIRGIDLAFALLEPYETVLLVDAAPRGRAPGSLCVLELDAVGPTSAPAHLAIIEGHSLDTTKVLGLAAAIGGRIRRLLLVGCEPASLSDVDEMAMGLSEPVRAAVDQAVVLVESIVARLLRGERIEATGNVILPRQETGVS
jgi:hydrogenase maturation protease